MFTHYSVKEKVMDCFKLTVRAHEHWSHMIRSTQGDLLFFSPLPTTYNVVPGICERIGFCMPIALGSNVVH